MSNKPRKKKKKPTKTCRPVQTLSAFDNYEQFEATMDNVIQRLNAQYDIAPFSHHDEEIEFIYQYLINEFGYDSTTAFKLHEVLISLAHIAERDGATPY
ncbi:hypothetical protein [Photobacterium damselae]|uniref:hypothetical protein n=1 Tax=Photobacterium damselae TaxID=38293 RepID=UPI001EFD0ED5|nr:hypothetical protein [Photobacterium damselae]MCG9780710.1 hypothetical protein [Photobacterium damselae]